MHGAVVSCPQCGKSVTWDSASRYRPFCSERCRLLDLSAWANEAYRIPEQERADTVDAESPPGESPAVD